MMSRSVFALLRLLLCSLINMSSARLVDYDLLIRNGEADMRTAMQEPFVSFCTDSGARATDGPLAGSKSHPRGWGTYPRILGKYVREERVLSLETAINKMTGAPAARVNLRDRGLLCEGMFADITIFNPRTRNRSRDLRVAQSVSGWN